MSTNTYLEDAKKAMVNLGVISQEKAEEHEHNVDDACYLLLDLVNAIENNPAIVAILKQQKEENESYIQEIMKEQEFMIDQTFGYPDLFFFGHDEETKYETETLNNGYEIVTIQNEKIGLEKTRIGVITDTRSFYANENLIEKINKDLKNQ